MLDFRNDAHPVTAHQELLDAGEVTAQSVHPAALAPAGTKPLWDPDWHRLSFGGHELRRYRQPAERQTCLLKAFHAVGWPMVPIPNPLPTEPGDTLEDVCRRLYEVVKNLNVRLPHGTIRFRVLQNHVYWERCSPPGGMQ